MLCKDIEGINELITALRNRCMGLNGEHLPRIRDVLGILMYNKLDKYGLDEDELWNWIYDDIADLVENVKDGKPLVNPIPDVWFYTTKLHYFKGNSQTSICGRAATPAAFIRRTKGITNDRLNEPWISEKCKYCISELEKEQINKK